MILWTAGECTQRQHCPRILDICLNLHRLQAWHPECDHHLQWIPFQFGPV